MSVEWDWPLLRAAIEELWLELASTHETALWAFGAAVVLWIWRGGRKKRRALERELRRLADLTEELRKRLLDQRSEVLENVAQHKRFQGEMNEHAIAELRVLDQRVAKLESARTVSLHPGSASALHALARRMDEVEQALDEQAERLHGELQSRVRAADGRCG